MTQNETQTDQKRHKMRETNPKSNPSLPKKTQNEPERPTVRT